jgi:hypothetical protein
MKTIYSIRTLLIAVTVCAIPLAILVRPTDPTRARKGMGRYEVWWYCGPPDHVDELVGWFYTARHVSSEWSLVGIH